MYKRKIRENIYIMTNHLNCKKTVLVYLTKEFTIKELVGGEQSYSKIHKAQHTGKTVGSTTLLVMGISE